MMQTSPKLVTRLGMMAVILVALSLVVFGQTLIKPSQIDRNWSKVNMSIGNITGTNFIGTLNGTAANATFAATAGNATYSANSGNATFTSNVGNATFAASSGNSTFAASVSSAPNATFASNASNATFAASSGNATFVASSANATFAASANYNDLSNRPSIDTFNQSLNTSAIVVFANLTATNSTVSGFFIGDGSLLTGFTDGQIPNDLTIATTKTAMFYADVLFFANISNLNGSTVNGSFIPALSATFDLGNITFRWRDGNFSRSVAAESFYGTLEGLARNATFASNSGNATFTVTAGNSTFAARSGNATFSASANYQDLSNRPFFRDIDQDLNITSNVTFVNISLERKGKIYHNGTHLVLEG